MAVDVPPIARAAVSGTLAAIGAIVLIGALFFLVRAAKRQEKLHLSNPLPSNATASKTGQLNPAFQNPSDSKQNGRSAQSAVSTSFDLEREVARMRRPLYAASFHPNRFLTDINRESERRMEKLGKSDRCFIVVILLSQFHSLGMKKITIIITIIEKGRKDNYVVSIYIYIYIHIYNLLRDSNEFSSWIFDWPILKLLGIVCIPINCQCRFETNVNNKKAKRKSRKYANDLCARVYCICVYVCAAVYVCCERARACVRGKGIMEGVAEKWEQK